MKSYIFIVVVTVVAVIGLLNNWIECSDQPLVGGHQRIQNNDTELLNALTVVKPKMEAYFDSPYVHRIGRIRRAYSQIVAGIKYHIILNVYQTSCLKSNVNNNVRCPVTKTNACEAQIWVQSWLDYVELMNFSCKPK
ncbi:hypothetical protein RDWZM_008537 [Blomia tropicalis]|uniref:Cystatin domain-containing protein n=1 Tax=Blomia tropicalis TaxID=40697 RepID=A0A9Q0M167_BLOTA|nr:hypothetical protein RDWZM_008537 [Blomia tropicalis]